MARARKGNVAKNSLKVASYGKQGSRKSNLMVDFAKMKNEKEEPFKVLYLDPENGSIDGFALERLEEEGVNTENIYIVYTSTYEEIEEYCTRAIDGDNFYEIEEVEIKDDETDEITGYEWVEKYGEKDKLIRDASGKPFIPDAIVIDGITVIADNVNEAAINLSEKRASVRADKKQVNETEKEVMIGTAGLEFKDHTKIKNRGKKLMHKLLKSSSKHVGITLRAKDEKLMQKNNKGEMVLTATGKEVPESWGFILYDTFTTLHHYIKEDKDGNIVDNWAIVEKDRSGMFEQGTRLSAEEMSMSLWQPIIEKNKKRVDNVALGRNDYEKIIKSNEDSYKKMIGEVKGDENDKIKTNNKNKDEKELKLETIDDYKMAIKKIVKEIGNVKKQQAIGELKANKKPYSPSAIKEIEDAKLVYETFLKYSSK